MTVTRDVQLSIIEGMDRPVGRILPSVFSGSNADLMAAVAPLYLTGSVLDVTYGEGKWWDRFWPQGAFAYHDLHKVDGVDFRALPEADRSWESVCFDPPYVLSGGQPTKAIADGEFQNRFGIGNQNGVSGWGAFSTLLLDGLAEVCRVSSEFVLVKCMEFAGSKGLHDPPTIITNAAAGHGWHLHDRIVHHTGTGPGGHNIFDVKRARRAHSYLLVFAR